MDVQGNLWVADYENNRIQQFNQSGGFISKFGVAGTLSGQLKAPASIAIDVDGNLWVADKLNDRIQKFTPKGQFVFKFGSAGAANGQFADPEGIAIDAKGNIWVSDTYNYRIQKFTSKGEFVKAISSPGGTSIEPTGIDIGPGARRLGQRLGGQPSGRAERSRHVHPPDRCQR